jgi:hypothetical protein
MIEGEYLGGGDRHDRPPRRRPIERYPKLALAALSLGTNHAALHPARFHSSQAIPFHLRKIISTDS